MLTNYIKVALRALSKKKRYAAINIVGLGIGMACVILIAQFARLEYSYDSFYTDSDRIFRINLHQPGNEYLGTDRYAVTPPPLSGVLRKHYPEVESATSLRNRSALISVGEKHFWEDGLWADAFFFDVFSIELIRGNKATALRAPDAIVLTEQLATKLFGAQDPINQVVKVGDEALFTVTGVLNDVPVNSSLKYSFITSHLAHADFARSIERNIWGSSNVHTFLKLVSGSRQSDLDSKLADLVFRFRYRGDTDEPVQTRDRYFLQPLHDLHLGSFLNFDVGFHGEAKNGVKGNAILNLIFIAIGFIILLLACINYMNLAIAWSIKRSNEIGLRKTMGADKAQIRKQFLWESTLIASFAMLLSLLLVELLLPFFSAMVDRPLQLLHQYDLPLILGCVGLTIIVGFISGSYPAFYMASMQPVEVMKGREESALNKFSLQRWLVVGQYAASIALIASGFVIYQQLQFIRSKDLGYDMDRVVSIRVQQENDGLRYGFETVRASWAQHPSILAASPSSSLPIYSDWQAEISGWEGSTPDDYLPIYINAIGYDYLAMYGIDLVAGRGFSPDRPVDATGSAIINERAARALGWEPAEAVGKQFVEGRRGSRRTIVGVVRDFHAHSMHMEIRPYAFYIAAEEADYASSINYISAKILTTNVQETLASMRTSIRALSPYPVEFVFVNDQFEKLYARDINLGETIGFFTLLALLIASMGLFGLAAFSTEKRTKEIGVRKVLGASVTSIVSLIVRDFTRLVIIAALIASPIAYFLMHHWLEGFAYRVHIGPEVFLLTTLLALAIALATVGHQAFKSALANPIDNLRYD